MKILFMGTPDFAERSLSALIDDGFDIAAVITQPDKPKGRGYVMTPPPVKVRALEAGLPVYQPNTLRDEAFAALLAEIDPDVIIVVAYGKILPVNVLDYPKFGCINLHGSLLPEYRGAAPIQRAVMDGRSVTGVTTMYMADGIDTGDMIDKAEISLTDADNFETCHDHLAEVGAALLCSTLRDIEAGNIHRTPQDDALATHAAKIEKPDCILDFSGDARALFNRIRGLSPFPLAFARLNGKMVKFVSAEYSDKTYDAAPGSVLSLDDGKITIACGSGSLGLTALLPEGKGRMAAADFIRGRKINVGDVFEKVELNQ